MSIQGTNGSIPFPAHRAGQAYAGNARVIQPPRTPEQAQSNGTSTDRIDQLVAGEVSSPINRGEGFDEVSGAPKAQTTGSIKLYSRAADVVEVATELSLGRTIDVTG